MGWVDVGSILPSAINDVHANIEGVCSSIVPVIASQKSTLSALSVSPGAGSLSADASALVLDAWQSMLVADCWSMLVHPFQEGVGQGQKTKTLSAENAVKKLAEKINDGELTQQTEAVILVLVSAADYSQLQQACSALGEWLLWPELMAVANRARDLQQKQTYENPNVLSPFINDHAGLTENNMLGELPDLIALAQGQAEQSPVDELTLLLDEKKALAETHVNALTSIQALIPSVSLKVNEVVGSTANSLSKSVEAISGLGHQSSHCALLAIGGTNENLTSWREVFA